MPKRVKSRTVRQVVLPPRGWRELGPLEIIVQGDKFYGSDPPRDAPRFHRSLSIGWPAGASIHRYRYFRRQNAEGQTRSEAT
jgi:hypothetical protein